MKESSKLKNIHVIGLDAGGPLNLSEELQEIIFSTRKIAAPNRLLEELPSIWIKEKRIKDLPEFFPTNKPKELIKWLNKNNGKIVILASGDPLWFGIGKQLLEAFPKDQLHFYPAPSSIQLAFAKIGRQWQDASWISLHGRDSFPLAKVLQRRPKALAILIDPKRGGAKEVREILRTSGLENAYSFWICERLGHPKERVFNLLPQESLDKNLHPLHLVILLSENTLTTTKENLPLFGIDDGVFVQQEEHPGLMTKREIRIQLLSDLNLPEEGILWDIGAGVGSIGLEALRIRPKLQLIAIEKRIGSKLVIEANAKLLNVSPSKVFEEDALTLINEKKFDRTLGSPDRVVLGGGGIKRTKLLEEIIRRLNPEGIIVIPLVTIEAIPELQEVFKIYNLSITISQHQSWKGIPIGIGTRLIPLNPVFILKGTLSK